MDQPRPALHGRTRLPTYHIAIARCAYGAGMTLADRVGTGRQLSRAAPQSMKDQNSVVRESNSLRTQGRVARTRLESRTTAQCFRREELYSRQLR